jgi:hypothetical protein
MSGVVRTSRLPEALWDYHRQEIERLYVKEKNRLEGEDGVMERMKKHHGFQARSVSSVFL